MGIGKNGFIGAVVTGMGEAEGRELLDELKAQLQIVTAANTDGRIARVISGPVANFEPLRAGNIGGRHWPSDW